jgi:hypothetical protein
MSNNPFAKLGSSDRFSIVARERTRYRFWVRDCRLEAPDYRFRTPISERGEPRRSRERRQKQVVGAAAPLVKALLDSEIVATPTAIETVTEQAETAKTAPAGIDGDQAIYLSRKTTGNFVSELLRSVIRGESAFAWKEYRAGIYRAGGTFTAGGIGYASYNNWPAVVSFVARNADALKE